MWNKVVDKDHSTQIFMQLGVLKVKSCIYLLGQPSSRGSTGRILYTGIGKLEYNYLMEFLDRMQITFEDILSPFFTCETLDDMVKHLLKDMVDSTKKVIETRWIFFRDMRNHLEYYPNVALMLHPCFRKNFKYCTTNQKAAQMPFHNNLQQFAPTSKQSLRVNMSYDYYWQ